MNNKLTCMSKRKKQHALVPRLRFPEFRERPPWAPEPIGTYLTESREKGSTGDEARKLTVKLWGKGVFEKEEYLQGSANTQYYIRRAGQFIYSKLDFLNQAFGIIPDDLDGYESTVDLPCFNVAEGLDGNFLLEYVCRPSFYKKVGEIADGGRKARRIQVDTFLDFLMLLPPDFSEQQKIAECLGSLDELIAAEARKLAALRDHQKGLMQQLFPREGETQPRLRFPEFRDGAAWDSTRLGDFATIVKGKGISKADITADGTLPAIRYAELYTVYDEVIREVISRTHLDSDGLVLSEQDDVIIPASGETKADIATAASVSISGVALGSDLNVIRSHLHGPFFSYYLNGSKRRDIAKVAQGDTVAHLYPGQLENVEVSYPTPDEQRKIADCLSALDARIVGQVKKLDALGTHKRGLMQQLFPNPEGGEA